MPKRGWCKRAIDSAVAGGKSAESLAKDPYVAETLGEAFRHHKTIGAWGQGTTVLDLLSMTGSPGVVSSPKADSSFATDLIEAIGLHRHWDRLPRP